MNWEPPEFMYFDKQGNGVAIDHEDPEDQKRFIALWDHEYRKVEQDHVGDVFVSTVFLPIDHGWFGGPPLIFETMVFGYEPRHRLRRWWDRIRGNEDRDREFQWRYSSELVARTAHALILEAVRERRLAKFEMDWEKLYDPR